MDVGTRQSSHWFLCGECLLSARFVDQLSPPLLPVVKFAAYHKGTFGGCPPSLLPTMCGQLSVLMRVAVA